MPDIPHVFLSATKNDLVQHRLAVRDAIIDAGCHPVTMEHFAAEDSAPLDVCLREVERCQAVVVLVAQRYGWIPPDQPEPKDKSITWLECLHAASKGLPIFAFTLAEGFAWPPKHAEQYQLTQSLVIATPDMFADVQMRLRQLGNFREWLGTRTMGKFTTPDNAAKVVFQALAKWPKNTAAPVAVAADLEAKDAYLSYLLASTATIDLQGIPVGDNLAHSVPIEEIYVPVKTLSGELTAIPLEQALTHRCLVIQGDPGSGKTTFLRRMVRELARSGDPQIELPVRGFPILIRVSDLDQHIEKHASAPGSPAQRHSPQWIAHFLAAGPWGLTVNFVEGKLKTEGTMVFLDGLDEAANDVRRRSLGLLLEEATRMYPTCRFAVATRPASFHKLAGFEDAVIEDLDDEAVDRFLELWSKRLHQTNAVRAVEHRAELRRALDEKPEIRRMARNPVMLTALAVVQWNERRLPEQRAELYDCVLVWLARAREQRPGRLSAEACLDRLGGLALAMQTEPKGRLVQIERGAAVGKLKGMENKDALKFLETEELDSGIIVSRGEHVRFWHVTFQEFLTARELAGMKEADQYAAILRSLYKPEWREVMLLLAGILRTKQGTGKVDGLFEAITSSAGGSFPRRAQCVALLSAMLQDLRPSGYQATCQKYLTMLADMKRLFEPSGANGSDLKTRVAAAEALAVSGHPYLRLPKDEDYWCRIPGHSEIRPFLLGRFPVTVWEYSKFVESGGAKPHKWEDQVLHLSRPVVNVNWDDASAYCIWANCRLPSSDEWQLAAQGTDEREYPWGSAGPDDTRANVERWVGAPSPVGMFPDGRSPYGCDDMAGNVWEWTSTKTSYGGFELRGGSWNSERAPCTLRYDRGPAARGYIYSDGFRCAKDIATPPC